ncbi:hypothetical protein [Nevskia sp.]|uniref:hypothetical protein n=1 Tax=Nevskia sp. TaxID=1929292 RepID=UPI0025CD9A3F|nr:hypothetical protein [Nevskia sp.]
MTDLSPEVFEFDEHSEGFRESGRIFDPAGNRVAVFGRTPAGRYTYAVYHWDLSEPDHLGGGFWSCCDLGGIYGDERSAEREAQRIVTASGQYGGAPDGSAIGHHDV